MVLEMYELGMKAIGLTDKAQERCSLTTRQHRVDQHWLIFFHFESS